ncbi:hypothetical protein SLEP1_g51084 [Rubroshorea leprosula]|uniref:Viral late gene transcription factor 3 zinc ribbon domain-containing protein n=1 Tax=Rubroshorea leprosula TaxID=152421 RepID=A0AAV5M2Y5_9ROSI|nr:hypothetical protein SLEP1_g51084 [Rubroshorea leprosula]
MKASLSPSSPASALPTTQSRNLNKKYAKSTAGGFIHTNRYNRLLIMQNNQHLMTTRVAAVTSPDPGQVEITWQIIVGAVAGVTPFIVAGIEFSKRIVAQRKCQVCGGSGLVLRDGTYFRCPGCGGFLPWQSWKRFFTG